jgi:hypothetical protein
MQQTAPSHFIGGAGLSDFCCWKYSDVPLFPEHIAGYPRSCWRWLLHMPLEMIIDTQST